MATHLEYQEANPLPDVCKNCDDIDCGSCDFALDRFQLTAESKTLLQELFHNYKKRGVNHG